MTVKSTPWWFYFRSRFSFWHSDRFCLFSTCHDFVLFSHRRSNGNHHHQCWDKKQHTEAENTSSASSIMSRAGFFFSFLHDLRGLKMKLKAVLTSGLRSEIARSSFAPCLLDVWSSCLAFVFFSRAYSKTNSVLWKKQSVTRIKVLLPNRRRS